jgi:hypothetical protein
VYGNDIRNGATAGVALPKHSAASSAITHRDNEFGVRHGIQSTFQCLFHVRGDWTRDEQKIGMPGARYEFYADAFDVVVGIIECLNLEFASIAGAGIDMANAESAAQNISQILLQSVDCRRSGRWSGKGLSQYARAYHAR